MIPWQSSLASLGVALGVGLLIGMEREQSQSDLERRRFGGIRTFALISLLGGLAGLIYPVTGWGVPATLVGLLGSVLVFSSVLDVLEGKKRGITTEVAALAVLFLGVLATTPIETMGEAERWGVVAAGGTAVMALLSMRRPLHRFARAVSTVELYSTAKLGVLLVIVVPLLPNIDWGPHGVINPFQTGLMVALISGLTFVGYLSVKFYGDRRGLPFTGFVGGLISAKPVTKAFAAKAVEKGELRRMAVVGIVLACVVSVLRVWLEVAVIAPELSRSMVKPLGVISGAGFVAALILLVTGKKRDEIAGDLNLRNPFALGEAFNFSFLFLLVVVSSALIIDTPYEPAMVLIAALGGIADIDAVVMGVARLSEGSISPVEACRYVSLALTVSISAKLLLAAKVGDRALGAGVGLALAPMAIAGLYFALV